MNSVLEPKSYYQIYTEACKYNTLNHEIIKLLYEHDNIDLLNRLINLNLNINIKEIILILTGYSWAGPFLLENALIILDIIKFLSLPFEVDIINAGRVNTDSFNMRFSACYLVRKKKTFKEKINGFYKYYFRTKR